MRVLLAGGARFIGSHETSVVALVDRLRETAGVQGQARHGPAKLGEQGRSLLATRAKRLLGWSPQVARRKGLQLTREHLRAGG